MNALEVVRSVDINEGGLVATDVVYSLYPTYSNGATYNKLDRVTRDAAVYESIQDGNKGNKPEESFDHWQYVEPVNRRKAFDLSTDTRARFDDDCFYEFMFGDIITDLIVLGMEDISSVQVIVTDGANNEIYNEQFSISSIPSQANWYAWTFEERTILTQLLVGDLPPDPTATIRVEFEGGEGAGIGTLAMGRRFSIGEGVQHGVSLGIEDFSRKERNEYGDTYLVRRPFAKTMNLAVVVRQEDLDAAYELLAGVRATPCLWVASKKTAALTLWGYCQSFDAGIQYPTYSEINIELEGLI